MNTRRPSLVSLKAFEAVARHCSFKLASEELFVTPGALSQQVKKLEENIGFKVFNRDNRKITLTGKGKELNDALTDAFICIEQKIDSLRFDNEPKPVRVSCGSPVAAKWLAPRLCKFFDQFPEIDIEVISEKDLVNYKNSNIDIGIRLSRDEDPSLERIWLHEETAVAVCSEEYAIKHQLCSVQDIKRTTLLKDDGLTYCRGPIWERWCEAVNVPVSSIKHSLYFNYSPEQAIDAAIAGTGVMIAAKALVSLDIKNGRLIIPFGPEIDTHVRYQVVRPRMKLKRKEVDILESWIVNEFAQCQVNNALLTASHL